MTTSPKKLDVANFEQNLKAPNSFNEYTDSILPVISKNTLTWKSLVFKNVSLENVSRSSTLLDKILFDRQVQSEIDSYINSFDKVDTNDIEALYLDSLVKLFMPNQEMNKLAFRMSDNLPQEGTIIHYATSSGAESAWLMHNAPGRSIVQLDSKDASVASGHKLLKHISNGRATNYSSMKRVPWQPNQFGATAFAHGALINRVPPFPLENREKILKRAYKELRPGRNLVFIEPNNKIFSDISNLKDFIMDIVSDLDWSSSATEFDLALVVRVMAQCIFNKDYHLFNEQMSSKALSLEESKELVETLGFKVTRVESCFYGFGNLLVIQKPIAPELKTVEFNEDISIAVASKNFNVEILTKKGDLFYDLNERTAYERMSLEQMLSERYGLEDADSLCHYLKDTDTHFVFKCVDNETNKAAAYARLIPFYELSSYESLPESYRREWKNKNVAGVAIYYTDLVRGQRIKEAEVLTTMLKASYKLKAKGQIDAVYTEVKPHQGRIFKKFGFEVAGDLFTVPGWKGEFLPVLHRLK